MSPTSDADRVESPGTPPRTDRYASNTENPRAPIARRADLPQCASSVETDDHLVVGRADIVFDGHCSVAELPKRQPVAGDVCAERNPGAGYGVFVASNVRLYSEGLALVFAADGRLHVSHTAASAECAALLLPSADADALLVDAS